MKLFINTSQLALFCVIMIGTIAVPFYSIHAETNSEEIMNPSCGLPPFNDTKLIRQRAVWISNYRWKAGETIPVYFMSGTQEQKLATEHCAREWERYGNFRFDFRSGKMPPNTHAINIEFAPQKPGVAGWSYVGQGISTPTQASMSYYPEYKGANGCSTIIHEFGHALGLHHEQFNPAKKSAWIPEKTYPYFEERFKWDRATIDKNIFHLGGARYTNHTKPDPVSVMAYYFPPELFHSGKPMGVRFGLSDLDIEGIQKMYPGKPKPTDTKPMFLYFKNSNINLRSTARNGELSIYVNGKLQETITSSGDRNAQKMIQIDKLVSKNELATITYKFKKLNNNYRYWIFVMEGEDTLFGYQCDKDRHCESFNRGFYLTHVSNGNIGGRYSNMSFTSIASNTNTQNTQPTQTTQTSQPTQTSTTAATTTVAIDPSLNPHIIYYSYNNQTNDAIDVLKKGADPNAIHQGWTPLLYAAYNGNADLALELIRRNANVQHTIDGWSARMLAESNGHIEILDIIDASLGFHPAVPDKLPRSMPKLTEAKETN